jgi:hypothetical protein
MSHKLDAVNRCLRAIGEAPVSSLSSGLPDAESAAVLIDEVTKDVLSAGWHSNTDEGVVITPDSKGEIQIPDTVLLIDTTGRSSIIDVTVRPDPNDGLLKLFDKDRQSFTFSDPLTVDIIHLFPFDDLPYALRNYISAKAARRFQEESISSVSLDNFVVRNETEAWTKLLDYEDEVEDSNALTDSAYMQYVTGRNGNIPWR